MKKPVAPDPAQYTRQFGDGLYEIDHAKYVAAIEEYATHLEEYKKKMTQAMDAVVASLNQMRERLSVCADIAEKLTVELNRIKNETTE